GNTGGSAQWARKWNKRFSSNLSYGLSNYSSNLSAAEDFFLSGTDTLLSTLIFEQRTEITDQTFRLDNTWAIDKNYGVEFGFWRTQYDLKLQSQNQISILQDSLDSADFNAIYADLERRFGNWQIKAGLRATAYSEIGEILLEPRASASYKVKEGFNLKAAYGIHHQFIRRLNERSLYLSVPETWTLARDGIVPILRSSHYIVGATLEFMKWEMDVEGYFKDESGSVEFLFPEFGNPTGNLEQFAVDGDRRVFGIDFLLKRSFRNQNIILGYTYLNAQSRYPDINAGNFFRSSGFSEHELNAVYNFEWKRWDFSAGLVVASGRPYTPVLGTFIVSLPNGEEEQFVSTGAINSSRLDWYHRLDLGLSYTVPFKKGIFQAGLSIYNVYNNESIKYIDYFTIPESDSDFYTLGQRNVLSLGLTPSIFLKLKI
ncbi:MAG TPA: TonB-dependent receptor, partial [Cryomorphaceae bacterium]|nr:TonB-dependent receptor [Cryomorphaceae bacterium]